MRSRSRHEYNLTEIIATLTPAQKRLLAHIGNAMSRPVAREIAPDSDILIADVEIAIANQLALHHATHDEKLNKKSFEYLLKYAFDAANIDTLMTANTTFAGHDLVAGGVRYSLKTQADRNISAKGIYIQKLMEARWIRDSNNPIDLLQELKERLARHLNEYDRILVLRAFSQPLDKVRYDLVEVSKATIAEALKLKPEDLSAKNSFGSTGADVKDARGTAFRILLDGSVEKIRIFNLRVDRCKIHGAWTVSLPL
jgi:DNA-binding MarR family transcriptional regulator